MTKTRFSLLLISLLLIFDTKAQHKDSLAVLKAAGNFVTDFNNFNWEGFRGSFTEDASIFYPFWTQAKRISGKQDIEKTWLTIFPEFADTANTRKLQINPKDLQIQLYGKTAIVTFHLGDGVNSLSRRTLVMIKHKRIWKIAHLHASSINETKN